MKKIISAKNLFTPFSLFAPVLGLLIFLIDISPAVAQVMIADDFTNGGDGTSLYDRVPNGTNVPGGSWTRVAASGSFVTTANTNWGNPVPAAAGNGQANAAISLGKLSGKVRINAQLLPKPPETRGNKQTGNEGSASDGRGVALGFFRSSVVGDGQLSQNGFTGLVLDTQGNLNLVHDPNPKGFFEAGSYKGTAIAFGGTFDPEKFHTLSYDIDTVTGEISNISLEGSTADYSSLTEGIKFFTEANVGYAGFYVSSVVVNGATWAAMDNFSITLLPKAHP